MERADRTERELPDLAAYGTPQPEPGDDNLWPGPDPGDPSPDADLLVAPIPVPKQLRRYLLPGEIPIIQQRQHIAVVLEPVLTVLASLVVIMWLTDVVAGVPPLSGVLVVLWLVLVARAVWRIWEWSAHWFVVTDRRLMRAWGVVTPRVGMLPMRKVTDMLYEKPFSGRLLRYGTFILESAGQDQALREIHFVVDPDDTYTKICAQLFGRSSPASDEG